MTQPKQPILKKRTLEKLREKAQHFKTAEQMLNDADFKDWQDSPKSNLNGHTEKEYMEEILHGIFDGLDDDVIESNINMLWYADRMDQPPTVEGDLDPIDDIPHMVTSFGRDAVANINSVDSEDTEDESDDDGAESEDSEDDSDDDEVDDDESEDTEDDTDADEDSEDDSDDDGAESEDSEDDSDDDEVDDDESEDTEDDTPSNSIFWNKRNELNSIKADNFSDYARALTKILSR